MSFSIGLSGLYAANKQLDVTGNNIANVATTGFKSSRAEFEDVYSATRLGTGSKTIGNGVRLANVSQQFSQGDVNNTGNVLDMGIQGTGFFILSDNGSLSYTRAGAFKTDAENFVVDNNGNRLQGYGVDANGKIVNGVLTDLKIDTTALKPNPTTKVDQTLNLNSSEVLPTVAVFSPTDTNSYNKTISTKVYDSQGNEHTMDQYYVKTGTNAWRVHTYMDGRSPANPATTPPVAITANITFNSDGSINTLTAGGWLDPDWQHFDHDRLGPGYCNQRRDDSADLGGEWFHGGGRRYRVQHGADYFLQLANRPYRPIPGRLRHWPDLQPEHRRHRRHDRQLQQPANQGHRSGCSGQLRQRARLAANRRHTLERNLRLGRVGCRCADHRHPGFGRVQLPGRVQRQPDQRIGRADQGSEQLPGKRQDHLHPEHHHADHHSDDLMLVSG